MAFGVNHLPTLKKPHTHYTANIKGTTFVLVTHFTTKIKLITFFNEWDDILCLRFEGHFTTHVTASVRMIETLHWHDENVINTTLLHKTLH